MDQSTLRGRDDTRAYPWGNETPDCSRLNCRTGGGYCGGNTRQVGSYPTGASPYGVMDMSGNVYECVAAVVVSGSHDDLGW